MSRERLNLMGLTGSHMYSIPSAPSVTGLSQQPWSYNPFEGMSIDNPSGKKNRTYNGGSGNDFTLNSAASMVNTLLPGTGHAGRDALTGMVGAINPIAGAAIKVADNLWKGLGIAPDSLDAGSMERFGLSGVNKANEIANTLFLGLPAFSRTLNVRKGEALAKRSGSYQATNADVDAAVSLSGKNVYFGAGKIRRQQREAMRQQNLVDKIDSNARRYEGNVAGELQAYQNDMLFNGYRPGLSLAKSGMKIPELEEARKILNSIKQFKVGGKFEPNVIPVGALHKDKHHLEEVNPELDGEVTTKGIPVISIDEDNDITQHAEIEKEEITFSISVTEQLEKFYDEYMKNPSDEIAVECGRFLTEQILKNTVDKGKLIKKIE